MFESQESTPWYRTLAGLIGASLILPPVGLVLLWLRRSTPLLTKALGTLAIFCLVAGYFYLYKTWRYSSDNEAHYAALEQHRAQQQAQAASNPQPAAVPNAAQPAASAAPAANGQAPTAGTSSETAAAHAIILTIRQPGVQAPPVTWR